MGNLRTVRGNRPDGSGRDKGTLQERSFERVRHKTHYPHIGQIQCGGLQPRNDSRPRFLCGIVRGCESPQGIVGEDYVRAKREQHDFSFAECRQSSSRVVIKSCRIDVLKSLNQYVSTSLIARNAGEISLPQASGAIIPVYKGKASTGLSVGFKVRWLRRQGNNLYPHSSGSILPLNLASDRPMQKSL